jgi:hypothetical protein
VLVVTVAVLIGAVVAGTGALRLRSSGMIGGHQPTRSAAPPGADPSAGASVSPSPDGASAAAQPSPGAGAQAARGGSGAALRPVDGGPDYYARFSSGLPADPSFFPIAVWFESVSEPADAEKDSDAGLNTYLQLTDNTHLDVVGEAGMHAIFSVRPGAGPETAGWLLADEPDMWAGPGDARWTGAYTGEVCDPAGPGCGYTVQRTRSAELPDDGRLRFANYGKGVAFWQSDADAGRFVNDFQDVVSADTYWFTDENICGAYEGGAFYDHQALSPQMCHRAANYGRTVDRLRHLVSPPGSKPVWGFVEVGHSDHEDWPTVTPEQVVAGVWSNIIHGARGIVYFNHSFGGPCPTQHALRESCYAATRAAVKRTNGQLTALAPVLNAPWADGVAGAGSGVDVSAKWYDGHFYLLAGSNATAGQTAVFTVPCVGDATVTVLDEDRTLQIRNGTFADGFADANAVHRYRIDGGSSCGAY